MYHVPCTFIYLCIFIYCKYFNILLIILFYSFPITNNTNKQTIQVNTMKQGQKMITLFQMIHNIITIKQSSRDNTETRNNTNDSQFVLQVKAIKQSSRDNQSNNIITT